jgi:hypothetical protein
MIAQDRPDGTEACPDNLNVEPFLAAAQLNSTAGRRRIARHPPRPTLLVNIMAAQAAVHRHRDRRKFGGVHARASVTPCMKGWGAVLSAHIARRKQKRPSPRVKLVEKAGSAVELSADHPIPHLGNALIMESLGTADFDFYDGLLTQLANVGTQGKPDERGTNFLLAMVRGCGPKDEIEAMMAAQMAAVHMTNANDDRNPPGRSRSSVRSRCPCGNPATETDRGSPQDCSLPCRQNAADYCTPAVGTDPRDTGRD